MRKFNPIAIFLISALAFIAGAFIQQHKDIAQGVIQSDFERKCEAQIEIYKSAVNDVAYNYKLKNQQLKDRIAELESK